jgi:Tfp pilus assembly PilM family ATPase
MADRHRITTRFRAPRTKRIWFKWAGPGLVTVLDLDGGTLRVAQSGRRGGKPAIFRLTSAKLDVPVSAPDADSRAAGKAISSALRDLSLKPGPVVMAVPRGLVFLRMLTLPAAGSIAELASIIQFQISKDLPFRADEAVIDFTVIRFLTPSAPLSENAGQAPSLPVRAASSRANETRTAGQSARAEKSTPTEVERPANAAAPLETPPPLSQDRATSAQVEVLVAVVKKEIVERYRQMAAAAGLKLSSLGLRSCANARCLGVRSAPDRPHAVGLISLRSDEVTIEFVVDQSVVFSRVASVPLPLPTRNQWGEDRGEGKSRPASSATYEPPPHPSSGQPLPLRGGEGTAEGEVQGSNARSFVRANSLPNPLLPSQESEGETPATSAASFSGSATAGAEGAFIQSILTEVVRSLHSYESAARHCPVEKILVAGSTGTEHTLVAALRQRFPTPCELFAPASAFGVEEVGPESGAGVLAVLGLALGAQDPEGLPFDFLNPKQPPAPRNWGRIKALAVAGFVAVMLFGLAGLRSYQTGRRLQIKEQVQAQVTQAEKNRPLFRDMRLKAKTVRDWTAEKRNWLDHYALLSTILPQSQDVYLTSLSTGARGVIHLSVQARSGEILAQMDKRLREAGYEVKPLAVMPGTDKFGYPFRSSVELTLTSKMKTDARAASAASQPDDDASLDAPGPGPAPPAVKPDRTASRPRRQP